MATKPKTPKPASKPKAGVPRTSISLMLLRQLTIHAMVAAKVPTTEIAKAFDLNRSFVIKQATLVRKPRNADERRIVKVAQDYEAAIRRAGFSGLLKTDEDTTIVLAGGERPKLGKLADRQAKRAKAEAKPPKVAKAPASEARRAAKPKVAKAKAEKPAPKPKVTIGKAKPPTKADKARHAAQRAAEPDSTRDPVTFAPKAPKPKASTKPKLANLAKPDPETLKVVDPMPDPAPVPSDPKPEVDPFALLG